MQLTVIVPTLEKIATAHLLGLRVRELLADVDVEVIIVTPKSAQHPGTSDARILFDAQRGVYAAYTSGLRAANGDYVWFLGDDDYPLDAASQLSGPVRAGVADVIACPVVFSSGAYYRPAKVRLRLLFRNWCQQGVLYKRTTLLRYRFYRRFRVQADHYVNIRLRADPAVKIQYGEEAVSVFGLHGSTFRLKDLQFRRSRKLLARELLDLPQYCIFVLLVTCRDVARWVLDRGRAR